jgi:hypothetical protein
VKKIGVAVLVAYVVHMGYHLSQHEVYDFFWTCNAAILLLGVSCLLSWQRGVAVGTSWLGYGLPVWLIGIAGGNRMLPTSAVIHFGGIAAGAVAIKKLGFPRGTWWRSTASLLCLMGLTRLVTPPRENVNLVFSVYPGWEKLFPTYAPYFVFLLATGTIAFAIVETIAVLLGAARRPAPASSHLPSRP